MVKNILSKYIEDYLCSSYYFDENINGSILTYLFKGEIPKYQFKLESYEIKLFKEYINVPKEFIEKFDRIHAERQVIHLVCSFTSDSTIETCITKYNLYISKKKFYKFIRNKMKYNNESKY